LIGIAILGKRDEAKRRDLAALRAIADWVNGSKGF
jgi:hypothetical protein